MRAAVESRVSKLEALAGLALPPVRFVFTFVSPERGVVSAIVDPFSPQQQTIERGEDESEPDFLARLTPAAERG